MQSRTIGLFLLLLWASMLEAGSVRLFNNSNFDLRAVVRGSDSSYLGEVVVRAQNTANWTDSYSYAGGYRGPNAQLESGYRSKTPYVVNWYCMDGKDFAVCDTVSTGAVVSSLSCAGPRVCHPPPKNKGPKGRYPQIPGGQYLQPEEQAP
jgi:hypothetical protein